MRQRKRIVHFKASSVDEKTLDIQEHFKAIYETMYDSVDDSGELTYMLNDQANYLLDSLLKET